MMTERVYLFNEKYAEKNGWKRDSATGRQVGAFIIILKVLVVVILSITLSVYFEMTLGHIYGSWIIIGACNDLWLLATVYFVVKHSHRNDICLNADFTAFIEKDGSLYYVKYNAPDVRFRTEKLVDAISGKEFFVRILKLAFEHQDRFSNTIISTEFSLTDDEIPEHEASFYSRLRIPISFLWRFTRYKKVSNKTAVIIRLDEVNVIAEKDGICLLKYKDRNRKWKKLKIADGYENLKENIKAKKYLQDSRYLSPFPYIKPRMHSAMVKFGIGIALIFLLVYGVPGVLEDIWMYYSNQKMSQIKSVEDLITEEMVLEVLNSNEELSFVYKESRVEINDEGGYSVYITGYDENTGKSVIINFNEIDTGTGFRMKCTDEWNAYLWISKE